jgi:5'-deoxynucleotidase YfbR-like HD superfamily hydrolase
LIDVETTPYTQTYSRRRMYPTKPIAEEISVVDIAHALSHLCRFTGHTREFFSVAQHSVMVSERLKGDRQLELWGLLHDASEAFLNDVAAPIKRHRLLEGYVEVEDRVMAAVAERFGLDYPQPHAVHVADKEQQDLEARALLPGGALWLAPGPVPELKCWSPAEAKAAFLSKYVELMA